MARRAEVLEDLAAALPRPADQSHDSLAVDFSSWQDVRTAVSDQVDAVGPVTLLVNNTGGPGFGELQEAEPEALAAGFEQHVLAFQALTKAVLPGMIEAGFGRIVNIISTSVVTPIRQLGVSNTIRGSVANWGRTLAAELGSSGVTVNNVLPGYIDTERLEASMSRRAEAAGVSFDEMAERVTASVPAGRLGTPEDIGATVAFLCSPAAGYVNGVNLPVDGGRLVSLNT